MITPTVGRIVWYRPDMQHRDELAQMVAGYGSDQPMAAQVCYVHSDRMVNLDVTDYEGHHHPRTSVVLVQEGDATPNGQFCMWMPYQRAVAKGEIAPTLHAQPTIQDSQMSHPEPSDQLTGITSDLGSAPAPPAGWPDAKQGWPDATSQAQT